MDKELRNCNFVRIVLIFIIAMFHSIAFWNNWSTDLGARVQECGLWRYLTIWLASFHNECFVLISGYVFFYLRFEKYDYQNYLEFIRKKIDRLMVPAYFVCFVWIIPVAWYFHRVSSVKGIVVDYLSGKEPAQLWFLFMLFVVFLFAWLFSSVFDKYLWGSVLLVLVVYGLGRALKIECFQISNACSYLTLFFIGFEIRKYSLCELTKRIPSWILILVTIVLVSLSVWSDVNEIKRLSRILIFVTRTVNATAIFFVLQRLASNLKWENSPAVSFLQKHIFGIYLFHEQFVYFGVVQLNGLINPYFHGIFNFLFCITGALIISVVLSKFTVTRRLIGMK